MLLALPKDDLNVSKPSGDKDLFKSQYEITDKDLLPAYVARYLKKEDAILITSSTGDRGPDFNMIFDFFQNAGYKDVKYLFENEKVLKNIKKRFTKKGRAINLEKGTLSEMSLSPDSLNVVLDLCSTSNLLEKIAGSMCNITCGRIFESISKTLKNGGRYLCLTSSCEEVVEFILGYFKDNWFIRLQSVQLTACSGNKNSAPLSLFILTKLKLKLPKAVMEVCMKTEKAVKVNSEEDIRKAVSQLWDFTFLRYKLRSEFDFNNSYTINFWCPKTNSQSPRYTVIIVDSAKEMLRSYAGKYGVFIVPQGREIAWLFSTSKGRRQLASMSGFDRIAITLTHRGHLYESLDEIKCELSTRVLQLAPQGLSESAKVPFVTVGEDIGQRYTLYDSGSGQDGCIVEDFKAEDDTFHRRLIFHRNPGIVQTEYRLHSASEHGVSGESTGHFQVDKGYLIFSFHRQIIAALTLLGSRSFNSDLKILLIGLGGAALPNFVSVAFPKATIVCVELNPIVVELAEKWFGFSNNEKTQSITDDGLKFIELEVEKGKHGCYHAVIFDVNTDDESSALTAPPPSFLDHKVLENVSALLHSSGIFIMNLVCRDKEITMDVGKKLKEQFGNARLNEGDSDELNVIVTCFSPSRKEPEPTHDDCLSVMSEISMRTCKDDMGNSMDLPELLKSNFTI